MRLTTRDVRLLRDMALSHVLSRDQIIALGYFGSVTRANTRLRLLGRFGLVRRIDTPFFSQNLYCVGVKASEIVGERIAKLVAGRAASPRFLQHALLTTNVRIELIRRGASSWRFEQQLWVCFKFAGKEYQVRPDGLADTANGLIAVEVDLGHVAPAKFREKLLAFDAFIASGQCQRQWNAPSVSLLTLTTGKRRASQLLRLAPKGTAFAFECHSLDVFGVPRVGGWS